MPFFLFGGRAAKYQGVFPQEETMDERYPSARLTRPFRLRLRGVGVNR